MPKPRVRITDIQLVITELSGEAAGQVMLQVAIIPASVHQVGRLDADQLLESTFSQHSVLIFNIAKFLAICCVWDVGKTAKETVRVLTLDQPPNPYQVSSHPLRVLEAAEMGMVFTF